MENKNTTKKRPPHTHKNLNQKEKSFLMFFYLFFYMLSEEMSPSHMLTLINTNVSIC